ncbi:hypothetical protein EB796_018804 [Bugula neritina]|uniref:Density-regulated protein n=1 Tax=Bugula neritina TaxID=10212 RepID=A0A7J7JB79_BUGNE|nr:hypothetical protein EB796_018804 [Bugula neritina]
MSPLVMAGEGEVCTWLPANSPVEGVSYPLSVPYCGRCGMPPEYCEFGPDYEKCKEWLQTHLPEEFEKLGVDAGETDEKEEKKRQKRGGKAAHKTVQAKKAPQRITLSKAPRGKRKMVTVVTGLATFGIDVKAAGKFLGGRFACGSSVTGEDEIVIQGDFVDDLFDVLPEKWPQIDEDLIEDLGEMKR